LFSWISINIYNKIKQLKNIRLKDIIKKVLREETLTGNATAASVYGHVSPAFTFKSRGPEPGRIYSPGFNYESKGPLRVSYFMEDEGEGPNPWAVCTSSLGLEGKKRKDYTRTEKSKYEKCVLSMKKEVKENHIKRIVNKVINEQETKWLDDETGKKVTSSVQLDLMTSLIQDVLMIVQNMEDNLSRRWE
tara:strand:+ start:5332 stop:5901 length:570 start_codon:yes stop_codon:yes gene_type:complete